MEYFRKCSICGKTWAFTDEDLRKNKSHAASSALYGLATFGQALGGTYIGGYMADSRAQNERNAIVDYEKCPSCGSKQSVSITKEQIQESNIASGIGINSNASEEALLKRIVMFLEDSDWGHAKAYCEQILDLNPECALAYVYKLMAKHQVNKETEIPSIKTRIAQENEYLRAIQFADDNLKSRLCNYSVINSQNCEENKYQAAVEKYRNAYTEEQFKAAADDFHSLKSYKDASEYAARCVNKAAEMVIYEKNRKQEEKQKENAKALVAVVVAAIVCILLIQWFR